MCAATVFLFVAKKHTKMDPWSFYWGGSQSPFFLQSCLCRLQEDLEKLREEKDDAESELSSLVSSVSKVYKRVQPTGTAKSARKKIQEVENLLNTCRGDKAVLSIQNAGLEEDVGKLNTRVTELGEIITKLQQTEKTLRDLNVTSKRDKEVALDLLEKARGDIEKNTEDYKRELEDRERTHEEKLNELTASATATQEDLAQAQSELDTARTERQAFENESRQLFQKLNDAEKKLESAKTAQVGLNIALGWLKVQQHRYVTLENDVKAKNSAIKKLSGRIFATNFRQNRCSKKLSECEKSRTELEDRRRELGEKVTELEGELGEVYSVRRDIENSLEYVTNFEFAKTIPLLKGALVKLKSAPLANVVGVALKRQLNEALAAIQNKTATVEELQNELKIARATVTGRADELEKEHRQTVQSLEDAKAVCEQVRKDLENEVTRLKTNQNAEILSLREQVDNLVHECDAGKTRLNTIVGEKDARISVLEGQLVSGGGGDAAQVADLQEKLRECEQLLSACDAERKSLRDTVEERNNEIADLQRECDAEKQNAEDRVRKAAADIRDLDTKLKSLNSLLISKDTEIEGVDNVLTSQNSLLLHKDNELKDLRGKVHELEEALAEAQQERNNLVADIATKEKEIEGLRKSVSTLEGDLTTLGALHTEDLGKEKKKLVAQLAEVRLELTDVKRQRDELQGQVDKLRAPTESPHSTSYWGW